MALGAFAMVVGLTMLTIIACNSCLKDVSNPTNDTG
jgi:hypothetical protein